MPLASGLARLLPSGLSFSHRRACCPALYIKYVRDHISNTVNILGGPDLLLQIGAGAILSKCHEIMRMVSQSQSPQNPCVYLFMYTCARLNRYPRTRCGGICNIMRVQYSAADNGTQPPTIAYAASVIFQSRGRSNSFKQTHRLFPVILQMAVGSSVWCASEAYSARPSFT